MRWDAQRVGNESQTALPGVGELVRTVRVPEFAGLVFHEVRARSVLNRVPDASQVPFRWTVNPYRGCSHACAYCQAGDTPILMADGRTRPIADLRVGDEIYGTRPRGNHRRYTPTQVLAHWSTVKPAYRIRLEDGTELIASGDHRFLTERGWKYVVGGARGADCRPHLTTANRLMGTGRFAATPADTPEYRRGYLCGMIRDDGRLGSYSYSYDPPDRSGGDVHRGWPAPVEIEALDRTQQYLAGFGIGPDRFRFCPETANRRAMAAIRSQQRAQVESGKTLIGWPLVPDEAWQRGFLAGIFDAEGSHLGGALRIPNTDAAIIDAIELALKRFDFRYVIEDRGLPGGLRTVRLVGGLAEHLRFFHTVDPAITGKRTIDGVAVESTARLGVVSIEPLGVELPLFDITTGTGDFIANGVVSHNCFARKTHTYLDFDAGDDFDSQVVVKVNAPEVLATQLRSRSWQREHVALGTNTDPYQRAEGRYQLMPGIIGALARSGTPFSILTKGTLLSRDIPLLAAASRDVSVGAAVSIALLDREVQRRLEPGTPSPQARLELVRRVRAAGLPCGVLVAPVLPHLTDSVEQLDELLAAIADAGATGVTVLPLHLRPGAREWFLGWLRREHPELVGEYRTLYGRGSYLDRRHRQLVADRVKPLLRRHGLEPRANRGFGDPAPGYGQDATAAGPAAEPAATSGVESDPPQGEQLSLL